MSTTWTVTVEFAVSVPNRRPSGTDVPEQILWVDDSLTVNLSGYCSDPDGHTLGDTASSSDPCKVDGVGERQHPDPDRS